MPSYTYMARDQRGTLQTGRLDAMDEDELVAVLHNRGLIVISLRSRDLDAPGATSRAYLRRLRSRVTLDDQVLFCQQLSTLLGAGVPLLKSLEVVAAQAESRPLLLAIDVMRQDIESGRSFRDAMARHPKLFSSFWVNLVETGEASGHLSESLGQLADYLHASRSLQQKAFTALLYPLVLVLAALAALLVFVWVIVPKFSAVFASMHLQLPLLTRLIIGASQLMQAYGLLIIAGCIGLGYLVSRFAKTEQGQWLLDRLMLQLPVLKTLVIHLQLAQFARGLSALLESGVPILFSLDIMRTSATNKVYGRAIGELKDSIQQGKSMARPMEQAGVFPPMILQMVQVGEEIGELAKMLDRVASYYEERVDIFLARMTALFEPVAIGVMGVVIGTIVIGMFLPIFSLATASRM